MSAAGDLLRECMRREIVLKLQDENIQLYGKPADLDDLTPRMTAHADEVKRMLTDWMYALPPPPALWH